MTDKPTGGPAFPRSDNVSNSNSGMTLRDWFAGQALAGFMAGYYANSDSCGFSTEDIARLVIEQADAMMEARK
jgi:hypothetical protein